MYRSVGHHGWGHHGWHGKGPRGFFFLPVLFLGFFMFFGLFKFLLPLIVIGLAVAFVSRMMCGGFHGGRGGDVWNRNWNWNNDGHPEFKRKHDWDSDSKPKRGEDDDSPRYTRTANGDWVEIV